MTNTLEGFKTTAPVADTESIPEGPPFMYPLVSEDGSPIFHNFAVWMNRDGVIIDMEAERLLELDWDTQYKVSHCLLGVLNNYFSYRVVDDQHCLYLDLDQFKPDTLWSKPLVAHQGIPVISGNVEEFYVNPTPDFENVVNLSWEYFFDLFTILDLINVGVRDGFSILELGTKFAEFGFKPPEISKDDPLVN